MVIMRIRDFTHLTDGAVLASREYYNISKAAGTCSRKGVSGRALYGENRTGLPVRTFLYQQILSVQNLQGNL